MIEPSFQVMNTTASVQEETSTEPSSYRDVNGLLNYTSTPLPVFISDEALFYIDIALIDPLSILVGTFGIVSNIINLLVFLKQGLKNTVTITFFSLAISDLVLCLSTFTLDISNLVNLYVYHGNRSQPSVHSLAAMFMRGLFYATSSNLVLLSAVERCLYVIRPFQMKAKKSRTRIIVIVVLIYAICLIIFSPVFISVGIMRWTTEAERQEMGAVVQWFVTNYSRLHVVASVFVGIFTPTINQILVAFMTYKMVTALRSALKFRHSMYTIQNQGGQDTTTGPAMLVKDRILAKMVLMISIIFISCNFPVMIYVYTRRLMPELGPSGEYRNLQWILYSFVTIFGVANSSVNIFIYYKMSSRYRLHFKSIFGCSV